MASKTERERDFRLRPRRPPKGGKNEAIAWSVALKTIFRYAGTSTKNRRRGSGPAGSARKGFHQRCAVRITYTNNKVAGQWRAHGRYIARESAMEGQRAGFSNSPEPIEPGEMLHKWQKEGDTRLWKFIISPEFGERIDLQRLTRDLMQRMEADLGTKLEWVAVTHFNTEHPHVHVALRGIRQDGSPLDLPRDYIKSGVRSIAEDLCTRQLGYRTQLDAEEARRREVDQYRMTSLDRVIDASNPHPEGRATFLFQPAHLPAAARNQRPFVLARLRTLEKMGLAQPEDTDTWEVRSDFLTVLRAMQQTADRQKTLAAHRALVSDPRLPVVVTDPRKIKALDGRVLGHGEGEEGKSFGRHYMLLEGTDAQIHLIYYTPELEEARSRGQLGTNSFVEIRKHFADGRSRLQVTNFGDAEKLLESSSYFLQRRRRAILASETESTQPWGGWLGRFHEKLRSAPARAERDPARDFER